MSINLISGREEEQMLDVQTLAGTAVGVAGPGTAAAAAAPLVVVVVDIVGDDDVEPKYFSITMIWRGRFSGGREREIIYLLFVLNDSRLSPTFVCSSSYYYYYYHLLIRCRLLCIFCMFFLIFLFFGDFFYLIFLM